MRIVALKIYKRSKKANKKMIRLQKSLLQNLIFILNLKYITSTSRIYDSTLINLKNLILCLMH